MRKIQIADNNNNHITFTKGVGENIDISFNDGDMKYSTEIKEENLRIALRFMTEVEELPNETDTDTF